MSTKTIRRLIISLSIVLILVIFLAFGFNSSLEVTEYSYTNAKIPSEFDGYRILQISDYHNKDFGDNQASFIKAVEQANPDIIVLTGDIVDEDHEDIIASKEMTEGMADIAPTYYITGNHELKPEAEKQYEMYKQVMTDSGVVHLDNQSVYLTEGDSSIILHGKQYYAHYIDLYLEPADTDEFNILLYHGSDNFDEIAPMNYDLVLSGHAHGGVIILPFVGGLIGNEGDLFPKYDFGMFENGNSTLIANRGVGDAEIPRFFNPPEITVVTLHSEA